MHFSLQISKKTSTGSSTPIFIQPKLIVNQPEDKYEKEADWVADKVIQMPFSDSIQQNSGKFEKEDEKYLKRKPALKRFPPLIHTIGDNGIVTDSSLSNKIRSSQGDGQRMDGNTEFFMSNRFGFDFSKVKIHSDNESVQMNRELNAKAFTFGNDIYFNRGQYNPVSHEGKNLLAHELTHTLQQRVAIQRKPFSNRPPYANIPIDYDMISDPLERMEMMRADYERYRWKNALERLKNGELEDSDLQYEPLRNRLTGLKTSEINALITKINAFQKQRDQDVADTNVNDPERKRPISTVKIIQWLEVRKEISIPMPDKAVVQSLLPGLIDSYSISLNDIVITVKPDTHGASQNETKPTDNLTGNFTWTEIGGKITDLKKDNVTFNPTKLEVTIVTSYKDKPDETSAYGKGTTDTDKYNETTTLRVHEGQHGTDIINYLSKTPMPVRLNEGVNGKLTPTQFRRIIQYAKNMTKDTCELTDQIGFSQDQFLQTPQGRRSGIRSCRTP